MISLEQNWIIDEAERYEATYGVAPESPSDWVICKNDVEYPSVLVERAISGAWAGGHEYIFSYTMGEVKRILCSSGVSAKAAVSPEEVAICNNGTNAISLTCRALRAKGARRGLILTPCYYSVILCAHEFGLQPIYYHLINLEDYQQNPDRIACVAEEQMADFIWLTDPIYSCGTRLSAEAISSACHYCNSVDGILVVDATLGGLHWDNHADAIDARLLDQARQSQRFVLIESISKRLFLNGMKVATVIASPDIAYEIEESAEHLSGGYSKLQYLLLAELLNPSNKDAVSCVIKANIERFRQNFDLVRAMLQETPFSAPAPSSGFYISPYDSQRLLSQGDYRSLSLNALREQGLLVYPNSYFLHSNKNAYGFRINLAKSADLLSRTIPRWVEFYNNFHKSAH